MLSYIKTFKPNVSKDKGKAPETPVPAAATSAPAAAASTEEAQSDDTKSPALSPADETFLAAELEKADEPNVIFPGSGETSGTTTPVETATPAEPVVVEPEAKAGEKTKGPKTEELMGVITARWDGLKRTVSSAAVQHRKKAAEKAAEEAAKKEEKKEEKRRLKEAKELEKKKYKRPEDELTDALEQLNLTAEEGQAIALSKETKILLGQFTQILKDIGNGAPTAYGDLTSLLDTSSTQLEETFTGLPSFLQKLIKTLPTKLKPELLQAAAAASPALATEGGFKALVTQPGALMSLLKGVVNILKLRFPMILGANAALSMGLFVVLLVLWYFYKRGKEVRLENEEKDRVAAATLAEAEGEASAAARVSGTEQDLQGGSKY